MVETRLASAMFYASGVALKCLHTSYMTDINYSSPSLRALMACSCDLRSVYKFLVSSIRIELLLLTSNRCNQTPIHSFDLRSKILRVPRLPYEIRAEISYVNVPTKNIFIVNHSLYLRNYSLTCSSIF